MCEKSKLQRPGSFDSGLFVAWFLMEEPVFALDNFVIIHFINCIPPAMI